MQDYKVETKLSKDGSLNLTGLPFKAGDDVEVIIRKRAIREDEKNRYPLRGKPLRYTDPFGSVAEEDWEALK
jgi:hypothetical protein